MEVKVGVHQRAKAVDEDDRADACRAVARRQALPQTERAGASGQACFRTGLNLRFWTSGESWDWMSAERLS